MSPRHQVILDCDPGVDDAMALYFALAHPAIDLLGLTTTFGNVPVAQATRNALYLCALAGRTLPVCEGVATPLRKTPAAPAREVHGADGLGNLPQRSNVSGRADARPAARFIVELARARPGELSLVAVGPLGNLQQALRLEPRLPALLKQVIVMGGSITVPGNVTPLAEANIWHDPHAADIVLGAGFALTLVGLDVTQQMVMPLALFERIAARQRHPATDTLLHAVRHYAGFYGQAHPQLAGVQACFGHDLLAMLRLVQPELLGTAAGRVRVVPAGPAEGQTVMQRDAPGSGPPPERDDRNSPIQVCLQIDAPACLSLFETTLMGHWLPV